MNISTRFFVVALLACCSSAIMAADAASIYSQQCAACHGKSGEGMQYVAPPLKGAEFVTSASMDEVKEVIRAGRSGATKKHPAYPSVMPPFPNLEEDEITALAEYLKGPLQE